MNLLPATASNVKEIVDFGLRTGAFAKAHGLDTYDPQYITRLWTGLIEANQAGGMIATVADECAGVVAWVTCEGWYSQEPIVDIVLWATDPHHDSRLIGGRLLVAAIHEATRRQCPLTLSLGPQTPVELSWSLARWGFKPRTLEYEWRPHG